MSTRISTAYAFSQSVANLQKRQQDLNEAQTQMTSGKRVLKPSDDPTAAARAERARAMSQRAEATGRAVDASRNAMTLTESALADGTELLQQARELAVAAGNASYSDAERADVANQIEAIRKQLLSVANRQDGSGGYVFSGQGGGQAPFLDRPGGVGYTGTGGEVRVASTEPLPLSMNGEQIWLSAASGNGVFETSSNSTSGWIDTGRVTDPAALTGSDYSVEFTVSGGVTTYSVLKDGASIGMDNIGYVDGSTIEVDGMGFTISGSPGDGDSFDVTPSARNLSVFDALDKLVAALKTPSQTGAQVTQAVQSGLRDIDAVAGSLQSARALAGETLNRIDGVEGRVESTKLYAETTRSDAEDLDMVQAISDFDNQQTGYQAALQTYASLQKMSLFDYING